MPGNDLLGPKFVKLRSDILRRKAGTDNHYILALVALRVLKIMTMQNNTSKIFEIELWHNWNGKVPNGYYNIIKNLLIVSFRVLDIELKFLGLLIELQVLDNSATPDLALVDLVVVEVPANVVSDGGTGRVCARCLPKVVLE